ncbi:MAG: hypothetical protein VYD57_11355 [Pseudomonadota bacterium]|nr:hypothetical protein [Pseudomonadota bacterium]
MKTVVSSLVLAIAVFISPAAAQDRFSGYYNNECTTSHVCDLRIERAGPLKWHVVWEPFVWRGDGIPVCRREFVVQVGGPEGVYVDGIASGTLDGRLVGMLDRGLGRMEIRSEGGCAGIGMAGHYRAVGD